MSFTESLREKCY